MNLDFFPENTLGDGPKNSRIRVKRTHIKMYKNRSKESVLDLTRRRHFAMIVSLKNKIKVSFHLGYSNVGDNFLLMTLRWWQDIKIYGTTINYFQDLNKKLSEIS